MSLRIRVAYGAVLAILIPGGCERHPERQATDDPDDPPLVVSGESVFAFDPIDLAQARSPGINARWTVRNVSTRELTVERVIASCGCVEIAPDPPFTLPPDSETTIVATVSAANPGPLRQTVRLALQNETDAPLELSVAGDVLVGFGLDADRIVLSDQHAGGALLTLRAAPDARDVVGTARFEDDATAVWTRLFVFAGIYVDTVGEQPYSLHIAAISPGELGNKAGILTISAAGLEERILVTRSESEAQMIGMSAP